MRNSVDFAPIWAAPQAYNSFFQSFETAFCHRTVGARMDNETPRGGDCVIMKNAAGTYDVSKVNAARQLTLYSESLRSLDVAREAARLALEVGGRILVSHYSTPRRFDRF